MKTSRIFASNLRNLWSKQHVGISFSGCCLVCGLLIFVRNCVSTCKKERSPERDGLSDQEECSRFRRTSSEPRHPAQDCLERSDEYSVHRRAVYALIHQFIFVRCFAHPVKPLVQPVPGVAQAACVYHFLFGRCAKLIIERGGSSSTTAQP